MSLSVINTLRETLPTSRIILWESFFFTRVIGKDLDSIAEDLAHQFFSYYLDEFVVSAKSPHGEILVDVRGKLLSIRMRPLQSDLTIAPTFDLRVPANNEAHRDIYILAGHCADTGYGYLLGFTTWDDLMSRPIQPELRYPSRAIPLMYLHPMQHLPDYLGNP
jgi:hypothetical protein